MIEKHTRAVLLIIFKVASMHPGGRKRQNTIAMHRIVIPVSFICIYWTQVIAFSASLAGNKVPSVSVAVGVSDSTMAMVQTVFESANNIDAAVDPAQLTLTVRLG